MEGKVSRDVRTKLVPVTEKEKNQSAESTLIDKTDEVMKFTEEVPVVDHNVDLTDRDNTEQVDDNLIQDSINVSVENTDVQKNIDLQKRNLVRTVTY